MDFQELVETLKKYFEDKHTAAEDEGKAADLDFSTAFDEFGNAYCEDGDYYNYEIPGIKKPKLVYSEGGSDEGSHWVRVLHFEEFDLYLQIEGYYTSYEGVSFEDEDWDSLKQVFPYETTVTLYSTTKK